MSEKVFNVAIAGCGKVAHLHAKAIKNIPSARLAGVWSRTYQSALNFSE
jgi:ornithine cyclodeaminase/alanine dehydrogenase-like protein (mu-crystallin family)